MPTLTNYHWSSVFDCVMHETDVNGTTIATYTHEPTQFGPLISETRDSGWAGMSVDGWSELGVDDWAGLPVSNPTEYYHHYDALGSTTMLTDDTGAVTDTFQYDAWGNQVARTGTTATPYRWNGRWGYQTGARTGVYYVRSRVYSPTVARWLSLDRAGFVDGLNLFLYCRLRPTTLVDASGMAITWERPIIIQAPWKLEYALGKRGGRNPNLLQNGEVDGTFNYKARFVIPNNTGLPDSYKQLWLYALHFIYYIYVDNLQCEQFALIMDWGDVFDIDRRKVTDAGFLELPDLQGVIDQPGDIVYFQDQVFVKIGFNGLPPNDTLPPRDSAAFTPNEVRKLRTMQSPASFYWAYKFVDVGRLGYFCYGECCWQDDIMETLDTPFFYSVNTDGMRWGVP